MDSVQWLQTWYQAQCDNDWEHQYGVKIDSLDNPGWMVSIDLFGTLRRDVPLCCPLFVRLLNQCMV